LDFVEFNPGRYDPQVHKDLGLKKQFDTVYIGSMNSNRKIFWVNGVRPQVVCGNGWERIYGKTVNPPFYSFDFTTIINKARIAYVFFKMPWGPQPKTFECPQITFSLIEKVEGVPDIFGKLTNKICFSSPKEAIELRDFYLENEELRLRIWEKEKEITKPYTYRRTCQQMLRVVK